VALAAGSGVVVEEADFVGLSGVVEDGVGSTSPSPQ
jgi:hypothetical protein